MDFIGAKGLAVYQGEDSLIVNTCLNITQQMELKEVFIQQGRTLGIICLLIGFGIGFVSCWIYSRRTQQQQDQDGS